MIQTIREQLALTREDISSYLGISPDMVKSIEMGRRHLPSSSAMAALALHQLVNGSQAGRSTVDHEPFGDQLRSMKRLYRKYSRRLEKYSENLEKMQQSYASACVAHGVYQFLVQSLTPARGVDDRVRLKWAQWKLAETSKWIRQNNAAEQDILTAEIAGLKSKVQALERSKHFPFQGAK